MSDQSRASAWLIMNWLEKLYVRNVLIENVPEFMEWGPLGADGRPIKSMKGAYYQQFISMLKVNYNVKEQILNAADYGDATTRKRLFIIARRPKRTAIYFPEPTHAKDALAQPHLYAKREQWRTAREVIDWSLEGTSIFNRKRPLSPNTMRRIMVGLQKYGGLSSFILPNRHNNDDGTARVNDAKSVDAPMPSLTATSSDIHLVEPYIVPVNHGKNDTRTHSVARPMPTVTGVDAWALAEPYVVVLRNNSDAHSVDEPLRTLTTGGNMGVAEPYFINMKGTSTALDIKKPFPTITTKEHLAVCEPFLVKYYKGSDGASIDEPMPSITANYEHLGLASPFLIKYHGSHKGKTDGERRSHSLDEPLTTLDTSNRFGLVEPLAIETAPEKGRLGLYFPNLGIVLDINFRMLQPHELAAAMSFPRSYSFAGTREDRVRQIGNAVPVKLAKALCSVFFEATASKRQGLKKAA